MIVNHGPSCPVNVHVMVGPQYVVGDADSWTSWNVLTNNRTMPIVPAEHCRFAGESGATKFLRELPSYGVMPIAGIMRDWRSFVTRGGQQDEPMIGSRSFSNGSGCISVTQQFASSLRAGRLSTPLDALLLFVPYDGTTPEVRAVDAIRSALPAGMKRWMARESLHNAPDEGLGPARTLDDAIADAESRGEPEQLGSVEAAVVSSATAVSVVRRSIPTTIVYRVRWSALAPCVIPANVLHFVDDAANVVCDQHGTPLVPSTELPSFYLIERGVEINDNGSVPLKRIRRATCPRVQSKAVTSPQGAPTRPRRLRIQAPLV